MVLAMPYRRIALAVLLCLLPLGFGMIDGANALLTGGRSQISAVLVTRTDAEVRNSTLPIAIE